MQKATEAVTAAVAVEAILMVVADDYSVRQIASLVPRNVLLSRLMPYFGRLGMTARHRAANITLG